MIKINRQNTDKHDRAFKGNVFAKSWKLKNESSESMRNINRKSDVLKAKKK